MSDRSKRVLLICLSVAVMLLSTVVFLRREDSRLWMSSSVESADSSVGEPAANESRSEAEVPSRPRAEKNGTNPLVAIETATSLAIAAEKGLYALPLEKFWEVVQRHASEEVRREGCLLGHCVGVAVGVQTGLPPYISGPCSTLMERIGTQSYLTVTSMTKGLCLEHANTKRPTFGKLTENNGLGRLVVGDDIQDLLMGLRSADIATRLSAVVSALSAETGLVGVDWASLKASGASTNYRFVALLATKIGCDWPGYCAPNSVGMITLCVSGVVCQPGEDFWQVAQNNLSPIQFEQLRAARVAGGP